MRWFCIVGACSLLQQLSLLLRSIGDIRWCDGVLRPRACDLDNVWMQRLEEVLLNFFPQRPCLHPSVVCMSCNGKDPNDELLR